MFETVRTLLPDSAAIDSDGQLAIGGVRIADLAAQYGTPLYVYDEPQVAAALGAYVDGLAGYGGEARPVYACKAFAGVSLLRLVASMGLGADVASLGELAIAIRAGVDPAKIVMHGNNKSREEIEAAVQHGVGLLVIDSLRELGQVERAARTASRVQAVLVRVTPGLEADTHQFIRTGHTGSKFGLDPDVAARALALANESDWIDAQGLHVHVGSQLLDLRMWQVAIDWLAMYARRLADAGIPVDTIDLGGGLGIAYSEHDNPPTIAHLCREVVSSVESAWRSARLPLPRLLLEPGRSAVGRAGVTVYEVGTVKRSGTLRYVMVDGGMSDNIRPMLYQARYRCLLAGKPHQDPDGEYRVAGKHCESGDVLIDDAPLPDPQPGDLLTMCATGAYGASMASNYNALPRPAVVFVGDGKHRVVVRRETIEDLMQRDVEIPQQTS